MSNSTILLRLQDKFEKYLDSKIDKYVFGSYLSDSIDALEGTNDDVRLDSRSFQFKFEIAEFADEDQEIESLDKVSADFKKWLERLMQQ